MQNQCNGSSLSSVGLLHLLITRLFLRPPYRKLHPVPRFVIINHIDIGAVSNEAVMKKICLLFSLFLFANLLSNAQDTIIFRNGDEVVSKILEVSDSEIKYHLWKNQDGPLFIKKVADIFMVKYRGGHKEVYDKVGYTSTKDEFSEMYLRAGYLRIGDEILSDEELKKILTPDEFNTYKSASVQRKISSAIFTTGIVLDIVGGFIVADIGNASNQNTLGITFIIVGSVLELAGFPAFFINNSRLHWVVRSYNGRISGDNVSLSIEPTFFHDYNIGGQSSAYGVGITLNF